LSIDAESPSITPAILLPAVIQLDRPFDDGSAAKGAACVTFRDRVFVAIVAVLHPVVQPVDGNAESKEKRRFSR
jgi:hypothetical protein